MKLCYSSLLKSFTSLENCGQKVTAQPLFKSMKPRFYDTVCTRVNTIFDSMLLILNSLMPQISRKDFVTLS